jgi:hypothetical protein
MDLAEVQQQKTRFQEIEAQLLVLTQGPTDYEMGNPEEETTTRRMSKKITVVNGGAAQATSAGGEYTSPA